MLFAGLGVSALLLSWFAFAAPLTGVEPTTQFIDCGPALIGRPDPLPDPSCADAYRPVVWGGSLIGVVGIACLTGAGWLIARSHQPD